MNTIKQIYLKDLKTKKVWVFCEKICEKLVEEINSFKNEIKNISVKSENLSLEKILEIVEKNNGKTEKLLFIKKDFPSFEEILNISEKEFLAQTWWKTELKNIFWHINPKIFEKYKKFFKEEYKNFFEKLLYFIENKKAERIHIFTDYEKGFLEEELLTASWAKDTILISNNFWFEKQKASKKDVSLIEDYIKQNSNIKPRNKEYIEKNIDNFYILKIDNIAIWIFEIKKLWKNFIEIWALALSNRWQNRWLWKITNEFIINNFSEYNQIFVTPNEILKIILKKLNLEKFNKKTWEKILDDRLEKMLDDNKKDWKNREMFIYIIKKIW